YSVYCVHLRAVVENIFNKRLAKSLEIISGLLYKNTELITNVAPIKNCMIDTIHEMMIEMDVAKPLRILSAYLTTTATNRPPCAFKNITVQVSIV
ncbi:hypothetical protein BLA29_006019, partial [Euroglyphus maynei]